MVQKFKMAKPQLELLKPLKPLNNSAAGGLNLCAEKRLKSLKQKREAP